VKTIIAVLLAISLFGCASPEATRKLTAEQDEYFHSVNQKCGEVGGCVMLPAEVLQKLINEANMGKNGI
jgi:hypothetical protein